MKKQGRLKSIARWTAWVLALLLPAMWVATFWRGARLWNSVITDDSYSACWIVDGSIVFVHASTASNAVALGIFEHERLTPGTDYPDLWASCWHIPGSFVVLIIPLWMPWLVALGFSVWFYRDHQREKQQRLLGCCPACGYSRLGLAPGAPCPECGTLPTPGAIE